MTIEIAKTYEPGKIESHWYQFWLERGYFTPRIEPEREPFVIIMPPPNVTGDLHLGHALTSTLEDIMTRWHRMRGDPTLWLPGSDHAGIATQVLVERELAKEGLSRTQIGRDAFLQRTWQLAQKSRENINRQQQMLGSSCDWTRDAFTLDEGPSRAVRTAFVRLYKKGLVYRGERMINWCPRCQTALSDLETEHIETQGHLYYLRYPFADGDGVVTVATTRPETFFGDTAVAVNPEDARYRHVIGREVVLPIIHKKIPVIGDEAVDPSFGTGALKITPAHDPTDFAVAERRGLPLVSIMDADGTMNEQAGPCHGLDRFACRTEVVRQLTSQGLIEKTEPYTHSVGYCTRCTTMVEPRISLQWFVRAQELAKPAIEAVRTGEISIIPERFRKTYFGWMEDIKDWCISRQLWWGHRIPVWYCQVCGGLTASVDEPGRCEHCDSSTIVQDPDVLDTWFSSGLWTHSTLGWPDDTEDMRYFYPTTVMETGYDILFFWVARMIMMGIEDTGQIPFRIVYLHGLLRDEHGEKMSKLRGNVIGPREAIDRYGVDAVRFALATGSSPGNDTNLGSSKLESSRNFVNKLWNASRFIFQNLDSETARSESRVRPCEGPAAVEDRWICSRFDQLLERVNTLLGQFEFGEAGWSLYDFLWSDFCDWYIEIAKIRLRQDSDGSALPILVDILERSLRLLHPFIPFVSEELWQKVRQHYGGLRNMPESIVVAPYPTPRGHGRDERAERTMQATIDIVRAIRNARAEHGIPSNQLIPARVYTDDLLTDLATQERSIETLARVQPLELLGRQGLHTPHEKALVLVLQEADVVLPWTGLVDTHAEERLRKEKEKLESRIAGLEARLADQTFLTKAPQQVVAKERTRLDDLRDRLARVDAELGRL
ncbi:MAG: valine--tRNA ligase [Chloroflexota bacterium]